MTAPFLALYIDDDEATSRLVQRRLERGGVTVRLAGDGARGLALAAAERFDVIALDHHMPGRDGLAVLADLRALPDAAPVVFVTATEEARLAVAALKEGAADFLVKDVAGGFLDLLEPTLRQAVAGAQLLRAKEAAEREVRESRDRLALLLTEVNHRVSNSLQLISSVIALQGRRAHDAAARDLLAQAAKRVDAVAMIHRRLYTSHDIEFVQMDQYLRGLIDEFRRAVESDGDRAGGGLELHAESLRIETDKAVSFGMIVNELVTNALKYAYPGGSGPVRVFLARSSERLVRLTVEDEGVGYPDAPASAKGTGVGGLIVGAMAEKLRATVSLDRDWRGTRFVLEAPG